MNQRHPQEECTTGAGWWQNRGLRGRTQGLKVSALVLEEATHEQTAILRNIGVALDQHPPDTFEFAERGHAV